MLLGWRQDRLSFWQVVVMVVQGLRLDGGLLGVVAFAKEGVVQLVAAFVGEHVSNSSPSSRLRSAAEKKHTVKQVLLLQVGLSGLSGQGLAVLLLGGGLGGGAGSSVGPIGCEISSAVVVVVVVVSGTP